jgi:4-aminobutyrate aminotransferase-like enzyme
VTIGKLSQICATLFNSTYKPRPGLISQTFTSSTTAIKCAKVILDELSSKSYTGKKGKIQVVSDYFQSELNALSKKYPKLISGPFGYGTMIAFTPFDGSLEKVKALLFDCFDKGVIAFSAGQNPIRVRFLVPIGSVTLSDIDCVIGIIERALCRIGKQKFLSKGKKS